MGLVADDAETAGGIGDRREFGRACEAGAAPGDLGNEAVALLG